MGFSLKTLTTDAIAREVMAGAEYKAAEHAWAEILAENAKEVATEAFRRPSGGYEDHIVARGNTVGSTWFTAHLIEWGTVNTPIFGIMRRSVSRAGMLLNLAE